MSYTIYKANGTPITVADNTLDNNFYNTTGGGGVSPGHGLGVQLVGRNTINYGGPIAQNFLQLTENFASTSAFFPSDTTALQGQLWFNQSDTSLYVRTTANTSGGIANWSKLVTSDAAGDSTVENDLTVGANADITGDINVGGNGSITGNLAVTGAITSGGHHVPVVYTVSTLTALPGDMQVVGSVISIWANGAWKQIFPAVYS
jgi:hypothetical protein